MNNSKAKRIAFFGMMVALAFTFSYLESLIPFNFGIPGVKLGLANLVVVVALYIMKWTTDLSMRITTTVSSALSLCIL